MKSIRVEGEVQVSDAECVFEVKWDRLESWCAAISLLDGRFVEQVSVVFDNFNLNFSLADSEERKRSKVTIKDSARADIELSWNQSGYFQASLLRAFRDGFAGADHMHLEGESANGDFDITVFFERFSPPMSAEEAEKLMS